MRRRTWLLLSWLAVLLIGLVVYLTPVMDHARGVTWDVWTRTISRIFRVGPLTVSNNLEEQIERLAAENVRLQVQLADYKRLRDQLGAPAFEGFEVIQAEVAARPIDPWHTQYVINRGARDGVTLGAPTVIRDSTLVGFIAELNARSAVLQLLFHPQTNLPADVLVGETLHRGLVEGASFTTVALKSVPRDVRLEDGQDVVSVSQDGVVPAGLVLGKLGEIKDDPHEPWQTARVDVPYEPERLYAVSVLVPRE